jgi:CRISPR-associated protein Csb3
MLNVSDRVQGSYGFDSDLAWDALTVGFSLNEHARLKRLPTRPAVELFGAIGLQRFFPNFDERAQVIRYATWHVPLSAPVARVAALGIVPSVMLHRLRTRFVYRGSFKGLSGGTIVQGDTDE